MIRVRNEHTALQTGELLPLYAEGDVMAFARLVRGGRDVFGEPAKDWYFISLFSGASEEDRHAAGLATSRTASLPIPSSEGRASRSRTA